MTVRSAKASGLPPATLTPIGDLLFSGSEPGAWYDPSDLSTLFQDAAGTVPVTAVEQPVGLILDKARPIVTNGDVRMNVLPSEAADWAGGNNTVVGNKIIPNTTNGAHGPYIGIPSTGLDYIIKVKVKAAGYSKFYISDGSNGRVSAAYDLANGTVISAASNIPHDAAIVYLGAGVYELSVKVNAVTVLAVIITPYPDTGATLSPYGASFAGDGVSGVEVYAVDARLVTQADTLPRYQYTPANTWSRFIGSNHATQATTTKRPAYSRRVNELLATTTLATQSVTTRAASYRLVFSGAGSVTLSGAASGVYGAGTHSITCTAGSLTLTVSGTVQDASLTLATDAHLPYQWVNTDTDYDADPAKFPAYLSFDGVDDALQTGNIDFTSTDKMTAWAGITKLSDAATGALIELSVNSSITAGTVMIRATDYPGGNEYTAYARGASAYVGVIAGVDAAPSTRMLTAKFDLAAATGQQVIARLNGVNGGAAATNTGGGSFINAPFHIGARAGTSHYFNGRLYPLIIRGAQSSLSQIEATELYIKQKMRMP